MSNQGDKNLKATCFRLPADRLKALRHLAVDKGISMGKAVEQAVETWMKENEKPAANNDEKEKVA